MHGISTRAHFHDLDQGHSGSAKAKIQCWIILTTKQATNVTRFKTCYNGKPFFTWPWLWKVYMAWPACSFIWLHSMKWQNSWKLVCFLFTWWYDQNGQRLKSRKVSPSTIILFLFQHLRFLFTCIFRLLIYIQWVERHSSMWIWYRLLLFNKLFDTSLFDFIKTFNHDKKTKKKWKLPRLWLP